MVALSLETLFCSPAKWACTSTSLACCGPTSCLALWSPSPITLLWPDLGHQQPLHYPNEQSSLHPHALPLSLKTGILTTALSWNYSPSLGILCSVFSYPSYYYSDPHFSFYSSSSSISAFNGLCFPDPVFGLSIYSAYSPCLNSHWKWLLNLLLPMSHLSQLQTHEACRTCASTYLIKYLSICVSQPVMATRHDLARGYVSSTRHLSQLHQRKQIIFAMQIPYLLLAIEWPISPTCIWIQKMPWIPTLLLLLSLSLYRSSHNQPEPPLI